VGAVDALREVDAPHRSALHADVAHAAMTLRESAEVDVRSLAQQDRRPAPDYRTDGAFHVGNVLAKLGADGRVENHSLRAQTRVDLIHDLRELARKQERRTRARRFTIALSDSSTIALTNYGFMTVGKKVNVVAA
jgi:hypothetical protein